MHFISSLCVDFPRGGSRNSEAGQNRRFADGAKKADKIEIGRIFKSITKNQQIFQSKQQLQIMKGQNDINFNILINIKKT